MVKSRRRGVLGDVGREGDGGVAAEGLDVAAEGRDLERLAVADDGDGAVVDAGRHRVQAGGRGQRHHRLGAGVGGEVDVGDRAAEQRVAHAAADEERAVAGPGQDGADRLGRAARSRHGPSTRVTDPASGRPACGGCGRWRPRCSAGPRAARSSGARGPARLRAWIWKLPGSSAKASGTSKTSSTSERSMTGRKPGIDEADERRDGEAGDRLVRVERAEDLDGRRGRGRSPRAPRAAPRRAASRRPDPACRRERRPGPGGASAAPRAASGSAAGRRRARRAAPAPRRRAAAAPGRAARRG